MTSLTSSVPLVKPKRIKICGEGSVRIFARSLGSISNHLHNSKVKTNSKLSVNERANSNYNDSGSITTSSGFVKEVKSEVIGNVATCLNDKSLEVKGDNFIIDKSVQSSKSDEIKHDDRSVKQKNDYDKDIRDDSSTDHNSRTIQDLSKIVGLDDSEKKINEQIGSERHIDHNISRTHQGHSELITLDHNTRQAFQEQNQSECNDGYDRVACDQPTKTHLEHNTSKTSEGQKTSESHCNTTRGNRNQNAPKSYNNLSKTSHNYKTIRMNQNYKDSQIFHGRNQIMDINQHTESKTSSEQDGHHHQTSSKSKQESCKNKSSSHNHQAREQIRPYGTDCIPFRFSNDNKSLYNNRPHDNRFHDNKSSHSNRSHDSKSSHNRSHDIRISQESWFLPDNRSVSNSSQRHHMSQRTFESNESDRFKTNNKFDKKYCNKIDRDGHGYSSNLRSSFRQSYQHNNYNKMNTTCINTLKNSPLCADKEEDWMNDLMDISEIIFNQSDFVKEDRDKIRKLYPITEELFENIKVLEPSISDKIAVSGVEDWSCDFDEFVSPKQIIVDQIEPKNSGNESEMLVNLFDQKNGSFQNVCCDQEVPTISNDSSELREDVNFHEVSEVKFLSESCEGTTNKDVIIDVYWTQDGLNKDSKKCGDKNVTCICGGLDKDNEKCGDKDVTCICGGLDKDNEKCGDKNVTCTCGGLDKDNKRCGDKDVACIFGGLEKDNKICGDKDVTCICDEIKTDDIAANCDREKFKRDIVTVNGSEKYADEIRDLDHSEKLNNLDTDDRESTAWSHVTDGFNYIISCSKRNTTSDENELKTYFKNRNIEARTEQNANMEVVDKHEDQELDHKEVSIDTAHQKPLDEECVNECQREGEVICKENVCSNNSGIVKTNNEHIQYVQKSTESIESKMEGKIDKNMIDSLKKHHVTDKMDNQDTCFKIDVSVDEVNQDSKSDNFAKDKELADEGDINRSNNLNSFVDKIKELETHELSMLKDSCIENKEIKKSKTGNNVVNGEDIDKAHDKDVYIVSDSLLENDELDELYCNKGHGYVSQHIENGGGQNCHGNRALVSHGGCGSFNVRNISETEDSDQFLLDKLFRSEESDNCAISKSDTENRCGMSLNVNKEKHKRKNKKKSKVKKKIPPCQISNLHVSVSEESEIVIGETEYEKLIKNKLKALEKDRSSKTMTNKIIAGRKKKNKGVDNKKSDESETAASLYIDLMSALRKRGGSKLKTELGISEQEVNDLLYNRKPTFQSSPKSFKDDKQWLEMAENWEHELISVNQTPGQDFTEKKESYISMASSENNDTLNTTESDKFFSCEESKDEEDMTNLSAENKKIHGATVGEDKQNINSETKKTKQEEERKKTKQEEEKGYKNNTFSNNWEEELKSLCTQRGTHRGRRFRKLQLSVAKNTRGKHPVSLNDNKCEDVNLASSHASASVPGVIKQHIRKSLPGSKLNVIYDQPAEQENWENSLIEVDQCVAVKDKEYLDQHTTENKNESCDPEIDHAHAEDRVHTHLANEDLLKFGEVVSLNTELSVESDSNRDTMNYPLSENTLSEVLTISDFEISAAGDDFDILNDGNNDKEMNNESENLNTGTKCEDKLSVGNSLSDPFHPWPGYLYGFKNSSVLSESLVVNPPHSHEKISRINPSQSQKTVNSMKNLFNSKDESISQSEEPINEDRYKTKSKVINGAENHLEPQLHDFSNQAWSTGETSQYQYSGCVCPPYDVFFWIWRTCGCHMGYRPTLCDIRAATNWYFPPNASPHVYHSNTRETSQHDNYEIKTNMEGFEVQEDKCKTDLNANTASVNNKDRVKDENLRTSEYTSPPHKCLATENMGRPFRVPPWMFTPPPPQAPPLPNKTLWARMNYWSRCPPPLMSLYPQRPRTFPGAHWNSMMDGPPVRSPMHAHFMTCNPGYGEKNCAVQETELHSSLQCSHENVPLSNSSHHLMTSLNDEGQGHMMRKMQLEDVPTHSIMTSKQHEAITPQKLPGYAKNAKENNSDQKMSNYTLMQKQQNIFPGNKITPKCSDVQNFNISSSLGRLRNPHSFTYGTPPFPAHFSKHIPDTCIRIQNNLAAEEDSASDEDIDLSAYDVSLLPGEHGQIKMNVDERSKMGRGRLITSRLNELQNKMEENRIKHDLVGKLKHSPQQLVDYESSETEDSDEGKKSCPNPTESKLLTESLEINDENNNVLDKRRKLDSGTIVNRRSTGRMDDWWNNTTNNENNNVYKSRRFSDSEMLQKNKFLQELQYDNNKVPPYVPPFRRKQVVKLDSESSDIDGEDSSDVSFSIASQEDSNVESTNVKKKTKSQMATPNSSTDSALPFWASFSSSRESSPLCGYQPYSKPSISTSPLDWRTPRMDKNRNYSTDSDGTSSVSQTDWKQRFKDRCRRYGVNYVDSHCHIDFLLYRQSYIGSWSQYLKENEDTVPDNYEGCVAVFCAPNSFRPEGGLWREVAEEDNVWLAMGCHPKNATEFSPKAEEGLRRCLQHEKFVALGEIGLDYSGTFKQHEDIQKVVFSKQIKIALDYNKPLVIHCRDAEDECLEILEKMVPKNYKIHCHCFMGNFESAQKWLTLFPNLYIGLTPVVTYRTAVPTHNVARFIPLERLLLETDAPYFVPRSFPKHEVKYSHPAMAVVVAEAVARYRNCTVAEVLRHCRQNTRNMYGV